MKEALIAMFIVAMAIVIEWKAIKKIAYELPPDDTRF